MTEADNKILEVLRRRGGDMWLSELSEICDTSDSMLRALAEQGHIAIYPGLSPIDAHVHLNAHNAHSQLAIK